LGSVIPEMPDPWRDQWRERMMRLRGLERHRVLEEVYEELRRRTAEQIAKYGTQFLVEPTD